MDVSIVIRTKNEAHFIGETLKRIQEQNFDGNYEIIIVDSGSTDSTVEIVRKYGVRLVEISEKEFTYGRSLNVGASSARHDVIVNLSAHAIPKESTWLKRLTSAFSDDNVAGVYGRQLSVSYTHLTLPTN